MTDPGKDTPPSTPAGSARDDSGHPPRERSQTLDVTLDAIRTWPATVDVAIACIALGISKSHGYELIRIDRFPCKVIQLGGRHRVVTASLIALLDND